MGAIEKTFAIIMIPLGVLIFLEAINVYSLDIGFNLVFIGACLMILSQIVNAVLLRIHNSTLTSMQIVTFIIFILPALAYLASLFVNIGYEMIIPLVLSIVMVIEALYALH